MQAILAPFRDQDMVRITQLINKTNQFNLTTRRYTQSEISEIAADEANYTLQIRLQDTFGDNGIISLVICRENQKVWEIDSWLMSCRVFKRDVERMVLDQIVQAAQERGITRIEGEYIKTEKNVVVENHYSNCGFVPVNGDGSRWKLNIEGYKPANPPIEVTWVA